MMERSFITESIHEFDPNNFISSTTNRFWEFDNNIFPPQMHLPCQDNRVTSTDNLKRSIYYDNRFEQESPLMYNNDGIDHENSQYFVECVEQNNEISSTVDLSNEDSGSILSGTMMENVEWESDEEEEEIEMEQQLVEDRCEEEELGVDEMQHLENNGMIEFDDLFDD